MPADIWIDHQGRVRREALAYSVKEPTRMRLQFAIDFVRFGVPVDVQLPDAGDTIDATRLSP